MIEDNDIVTFVINLIPVSLLESDMFDLQVSSPTSFEVAETNQNNPLSLLGTAIGSLASKSKLFTSQKTSAKVNVNFKISRARENGRIFINTMIAFKAYLRSVANVPCQFFGLGVVMLLGFVESDDMTVTQFDDFCEISMSFEEKTTKFLSFKKAPKIQGNILPESVGGR